MHLWRADLRVSADALKQFYSTLAKEEKHRAKRFYFERDRNRFIAARGILRQLLGRYLQQAPAALTFHYNDYGKPLLATSCDLSFNVSHKAHLALYGFARQAVIGVDVETIQADLDWTSLARHVFAAGERAAIHGLPPESQLRAFFRCWTCKEAFIKTDGRGISLPLDQFEVEVDPEKPARIKAVQWQPELSGQWDMRSFSVAPNAPGAVVLTRKIASQHFFDWSGRLDHSNPSNHH